LAGKAIRCRRGIFQGKAARATQEMGETVTRDEIVRRALWISVAYNGSGALLFAFPSTVFGQLAGLPPDVPALYRALMAWFVVLFGGTYAWLARRPVIDRPLLGFAAIGKAGAFAVSLAAWMSGVLPLRGVLAVAGDLALAGVFAWWLLTSPASLATGSGEDRGR
jgi:hypothetical protein